jgi:hypothetical protein
VKQQLNQEKGVAETMKLGAGVIAKTEMKERRFIDDKY